MKIKATLSTLVLSLVALSGAAETRCAWRGLMLDESRFFFGKKVVFETLDRMSKAGLNVFHWHLTDDQGWRLEIPGSPELTRLGAVRSCSPKPQTENVPDGRVYGPFRYTPSDVREVCAYAAARGIRVVPEIELPGHVGALLTAHPEFSCTGLAPTNAWTFGVHDDVLCVGNDGAIRFLERVLDETCRLFPDSVIHIGGDECPAVRWRNCPKCRARAAALGLGDPGGLQGWVTRHFAAYLAKRGRRAMAWDEILVGGTCPTNVIVQSWRIPGPGHGLDELPAAVAARRGHDVVLSPWDRLYFSLPHSRDDDGEYRYPISAYRNFISCDDLRGFRVGAGFPAELRAHLLGAECCCWTEGTRNADSLRRKTWPRAAVFAAHAFESGAVSAGAVKVAFPAPATSLYGLAADEPGVVMPAFLEDALLRSDAYVVVRFEDADDVADGADAIVGWKLSEKKALVTVKTKSGERKAEFAAKSGPARWDAAALGALDLVLAATGPSEAEARRIRAFAATRKGVLTSFYFIPGIVNTANANDGEMRFNRALGDWKASRKSKLLAAAIVAAAHRREENPLPAIELTASRAVQTALSVLPDALESAAPELAYPFLRAHEKEVRASIAQARAGGGEDDVSLGEEGDGELRPGQRKVLDFLDGRVQAPARRQVVRIAAKNPSEHPYLVRRRLENACAAKDLATIEKAIADKNFATRLLAVRLLAKADVAKGRVVAAKMLADKDEWVRFYAATVLATSATAAERAAVSAALEKEANPATRLYLADALARAEGRDPPPPQPSANAPGADGRVTVWCSGYNGFAADVSPYTGYYTCDVPRKPEASQARKNAAGACVLPRMWPAGNPGQLFLSRDLIGKWRMLLTKAQLPAELVPTVDGCVFGEENMNMNPDGLWADGWRCFCAEEKIDAGRVKGLRKNLTKEEDARFVRWAYRLSVDGFNEAYDFAKAYFGKLRPGFLVCTFMPGETWGQTPFNGDWKFDLGGAYVYDGDVAAMVDRVRYFKATWPDRPVLWLGYGNIDLGIGGSVRKAPIRYSTKLPRKPFAHTYEHYYANNVAAWIAGADVGMFTHYEGGLPTGNGIGAYLQGEDIAPGSPSLKSFVDYLFTGAERDFATREAAKDLKKKGGPSLDDEDGLDDREAGERDALSALRREVTEGFLLCQRATDDAARVFRGLVRNGTEDNGVCGRAEEERIGLFTRRAGGVTAYAATRDCKTTFGMTGCELLTGEWDATFDAKRKAALVAEEHAGPFVVVHKGVSAFVRARPFASVKTDGDGIVLEGEGEVRVTRRGRNGSETIVLKAGAKTRISR